MEEFMSRALCVNINAEDEKHIDFSTAPASGEEYLKRVMIEARRCEEVVVANIEKKRVKQQTVKYSAETGCAPAPEGYRSTLEWQSGQVADFSNVRHAMSRYLLKQIKTKPPKPFPRIDDAEGWILYCFGSRTRESSSQLLENEDLGTEPLLSIISAMNQPLVEAVLEHHIEWFESRGFTELQGKWLYALLVRLEKPLTPEMCSLLRNLARLCAKTRASLESPEDPLLPPLNLFICLVSRYFGQMDLADS